MSTVGNALAWPFWNRGEGRLRWGWRFVVPVWVSLLLLAIWGATMTPFVRRLTPEFPAVSDTLSTMVMRLLIVLALFVLWARFVDRRRIADYGFHINREWFVDLGGGMLLGASVPLMMFVVASALGWWEIASFGGLGVAFVWAFLIGIVAVLLGSLWEETLYRGVIFKNAAEGLRSMGISPRAAVLGALVLSSLAFTHLHSGFFNGLPYFLYYMVGALQTGLVYVFTGELAFPIGVHAMYNFFSANVVTAESWPGEPVLIQLEQTDSAPRLFMASQGGLLELMLTVFSMLLMLAWVRWRKGNLKIQTDLTEWTPRGARKPHGSGRVV